MRRWMMLLPLMAIALLPLGAAGAPTR